MATIPKKVTVYDIRGLEYKVQGFWIKEIEAVGKTLVKEVTAAFDRAGVPYFLTCGTLLGCIREGKFIAIDRDIDFGICAENYTPKLIEEFKKIPNARAGSRIAPASKLRPIWYGPDDKEEWITRQGVRLVSPISKHAIGCDIYFYYLGKGVREGYREQMHFKKSKHSPRHMVENLKTVKFYDMEVSVPEEAEAFLEILYSKHWRTRLEDIYPWKYFKGVAPPPRKRRK